MTLAFTKRTLVGVALVVPTTVIACGSNEGTEADQAGGASTGGGSGAGMPAGQGGGMSVGGAGVAGAGVAGASGFGGLGGLGSGGAAALGGASGLGGTVGSNGGAAAESSGGAGAGAGGMAGDSGSAGAAGSAGQPPVAAPCSEATLRTGPPPGKEMFRTEPVDDAFPFSSHWMGVFSDDGADEATRFISMTSLSDLDRDGDLDFATGQRHDVGGGMVYWEYCSPDHWVRHAVGTGHTSAAGGNAVDVDGDGWVDLLAGNSWYRNPAPPAAGAWARHGIGAPGAEELIVGEVTGDTRPDVLYVWRSINPQFWSPGPDPTAPWIETELTTDTDKRQQQGGAIADLDGDGRDDIVVGYQWWYRNVDADGQTWEAVPLLANGFDNEPLTHVGDIDLDGDMDVVMCTHFGSSAGSARVAWAENDGTGRGWTLHPIASGKSFTHAIVAADFDNDGDLDVFVGQNVGEQWIFANDGQGGFSEHVIATDSRGHEARVGDIDCDGDLDITGKPWGQANEGGEGENPPRDHVYLKNESVENGGPALFARGPHEVLPATSLRVCP